MRRILVVTADRSEEGLLRPVIDELAHRQDVGVIVCRLQSNGLPTGNLSWFMQALGCDPDIILIPCDRNEMVYVAAYAFQHGYVVAHFHAGNNSANHPDDQNRRAISLFSHILLCNMKDHKQNLIKQGEDAWRIFVVGSTAFDKIEYDDSLIPKKPFDLVILHPDPTSEKKTERDIDSVLEKLHQPAIWIYPNHDKNYEIVEHTLDWWTNVQASFVEKGIITYRSLLRPQFLSLLKHCTRAVGNSSSFYYELPILNPKAKLIQIGERNKGLIVPQTKIGGSKRIADLLATIEITEKLRNKRLAS